MAELPKNSSEKDGKISQCDHCSTNSEITPVITYIYQGEEKKVCVHCLPMLIHG